MQEMVQIQAAGIKEPMPGETTSLRLSKETKDRISNFGRAGESLETALIRALDKAEKYDKEQEKRGPHP